MTLLNALSAGLALPACYMLACRIEKMRPGVTQPAIFWQHAALAMGLFTSFLLTFSERWNDLALAPTTIGVIAFLGVSTKRWARGAPEDTATKPGDLPAA